MAEPAPILQLEGLRKRFGGLAVTDDVSLTVAARGIHAVIGPNGAGKTTLIHQISGTLAPDAGRIRFAGRDITTLPLHRRARLGLARSFQITAVLPGFSALENVALAVQSGAGSSFRFCRPAAAEARLNTAALAALAEVGLEHRAAVAAGALSHGEKRQLELAIALALQPRLLLLDEPLAGAGPEETERLIGILRRLKSAYAILLVEHDMQAVFALADRISVLSLGRVIATGTPEAIRADPEVRAAYLGEEE
ncbi:ABC transporter ATP-binding protein [Siccirubricoccus deserti]|uniref:ABC transporter ATP-binding protein n=1 Tax=Siccirubricoccus deserti TaxID=2013562 RepID=A0A9X0QXR1_9PROT|nr:ABC transporter ATP-binding protein [Siccirubricoccus deserti]MBC4015555.1 ABC transporter ATP-binding protein [Siccirubricoccus deserti]GGC42661.1 ABC transporter ATP-binding protein [Siccirubricoccus deserti]